MVPGLVQTDVLMNADMPYGLKYLATYAINRIAARTFDNTAASYPDTPVLLAANKKAIQLVEKQGIFLKQKNMMVSLGLYA